MTFKTLLHQKRYGFVVYSFSPPKYGSGHSALLTLNQRRINRIAELEPDGLCVYDIQDEPGRIGKERPFPFHKALPSVKYSRLLELHSDLPQVVYLVAAKYNSNELSAILAENPGKSYVMVGGSGGHSQNTKKMDSLSLEEAIHLGTSSHTGAVFIGERDIAGQGEAERMIKKINSGTDFFISQCIFDADLYLPILDRYTTLCIEKGIAPKPLTFTLSPAGDIRTIAFLEWLGIYIPDYLKQQLLPKDGFLSETIYYLKTIAIRLAQRCRELEIPFGFNLESVIATKAGTLASVALGNLIKEYLESVSATRIPESVSIK